MSKYSVRLSLHQRKSVEQVVRSGTAPARKIMHAQILLKADKGEQGPGWSDQQIRDAIGVGESVIRRVRQRFVEQGLEDALNRRQQPARPAKQKLDGEQEAHLIALMCTQQPEGQERWTLRTLADRLVELEIVESVSHETVRSVLKKMSSNRGKKSSGV
jgi:transposase